MKNKSSSGNKRPFPVRNGGSGKNDKKGAKWKKIAKSKGNKGKDERPQQNQADNKNTEEPKKDAFAPLQTVSANAFSDLLGTIKSSKQLLRKMEKEFVDEQPEKTIAADDSEEEEESNDIHDQEDDGDNSSEEEDDIEAEVEGEDEAVDDNDDADDDEGDENEQHVKDPFKVRYEQDLPEEVVDTIQQSTYQMKNKQETFAGIKETFVYCEETADKLADYSVNLTSASVSNGGGDKDKHDLLEMAQMKEKLRERFAEQNAIKKKNPDGRLTPLQQDLLGEMVSYRDLFYLDRTHQNAEEIRRVYCLHAVNHILKTRARIVKNNAKLAHAAKLEKEKQDQLKLEREAAGEAGKKSKKTSAKQESSKVGSEDKPTSSNNIDTEEEDATDCMRDQGLTRPKVVILVPFRDAAWRIVNLITKMAIISGTKAQIMKKKRFKEEFAPEAEEKEKKNFLPDDHKAAFQGNIDDCFRVGIKILRSTVKLYSHFYDSDIIVASPLGLRTIIGAEGEKKQEYDFLSSIEVLIMDQTDVFLMQNWEHVWHVLDHTNLVPKQSHGTDFSRVRMWTVNQWAKLYRQTLVFSSVQTPEISCIFNKHCHNYAGKVRVRKQHTDGSVQQVSEQVPQMFHRISCTSHADAADERFKYFIDNVLPDLKRTYPEGGVAVFVPSYFDFVRIRNHFKREEMNFAQISEYSKRSNIARSRQQFLERSKQFLIFTERFYFFYRYRIRGVRALVLYQLPTYPHFYPEIINAMGSAPTKVAAEDPASTTGSASLCMVLYSKYDGFKLESVLGTERSAQMFTSKKYTHMMVTK